MYKRSGMMWAELGRLARVTLGSVDDGTYHGEYGRLVAVPEDGPDFSSSSATARLFDGSEATTQMYQFESVSDSDMGMVEAVEQAAGAFTDTPKLNRTQWAALELLYQRATSDERGPTISRGVAGVSKPTVLVLVRHGLAVLYSQHEPKRHPEGMEKRSIPSEHNWYSEITGLGRTAWEKHAAPVEERPGYSKVPGLDRWVKVREEPAAAPARPSRTKVQMTPEGVPTGRYAVETAYGLEFFWIKLEGEKHMQHTAVRRLMDDGKWRMYYGGSREVLKLIKAAGWEAASRYGEAKQTCAICGRPLTVSAIKGIGPECEQLVGENPFGPNN